MTDRTWSVDFIPPMLAAAQTALDKIRIEPGAWIAEQKYDGHRMIVRVGDTQDLFGRWKVTAWSRDGIARELPRQIKDVMADMPRGVYDGELLVPGGKSFDVTRLDMVERLHLVIFDVLERSRVSVIESSLQSRRNLLEDIFRLSSDVPVSLSQQHPIREASDIQILAEAVWAVGGEGLVVKKLSSWYRPGKRPKDWIKVKKLRSAVLKVTGFKDGTRGPNTVFLLTDDDGNQTSVKAKNDNLIAHLLQVPTNFLGRLMRIEFQERTPDGSYRHPRMDRWEDE